MFSSRAPLRAGTDPQPLRHRPPPAPRVWFRRAPPSCCHCLEQLRHLCARRRRLRAPPVFMVRGDGGARGAPGAQTDDTQTIRTFQLQTEQLKGTRDTRTVEDTSLSTWGSRANWGHDPVTCLFKILYNLPSINILVSIQRFLNFVASEFLYHQDPCYHWCVHLFVC